MQVDEWLRQTDNLIRAGRYFAADEMLQKVFAVDSENETAKSYEQRIQYLIQQLSQRVGLSKDLQIEIRKYKDLLLQRKSDQLNSFLLKARQSLESGYVKKASEYINKALALDPNNVYAKTFKQHLEEHHHAEGSAVDAGAEIKFRSVLKESWAHGPPSEAQLQVLRKLQQELHVSDERRPDLEKEVRSAFYKEALQEIWRSGGLPALNPELVNGLQKKYDISRIEHSLIESDLLKEVRKNRVKGTVLVVDEDEKVLLEFAQVLRANSYAVIAAGSFDEALVTLKSIAPDIIISEVYFDSKPNGFELFELIRTTKATREIPFFFVTTSLDRITHLTGKRLGVDEFITKPIDYELLLSTMSGKLLSKEDEKRTPSDSR